MKQFILVVAAASFLSGCVSADKYKDAVQQKESLAGEVDMLNHKVDSLNAAHKTALDKMQADLQAQSAQVDKLTKTIDSMKQEAETLKTTHTAELVELKKKIDDAQADATAKSEEIETLKKSVAGVKATYAKKMAAIKAAIGSLQKTLDETGELPQ